MTCFLPGRSCTLDANALKGVTMEIIYSDDDEVVVSLDTISFRFALIALKCNILVFFIILFSCRNQYRADSIIFTIIIIEILELLNLPHKFNR
jgi:hypothetical protein